MEVEERQQLFIIVLCGVLAALASASLKNYVMAALVAGSLLFAVFAWLFARRWSEA